MRGFILKSFCGFLTCLLAPDYQSELAEIRLGSVEKAEILGES